MNKLLDEALVAIAVMALTFIGGAVTGHRMAERTWQPRYEAAVAKAEANAKTVVDLKAAQAAQDDALAKIKADAEAKAKASKEALEKATLASKTIQSEAIRIISEKPKPGIDECKAASDAFDDELRKERAK